MRYFRLHLIRISRANSYVLSFCKREINLLDRTTSSDRSAFSCKVVGDYIFGVLAMTNTSSSSLNFLFKDRYFLRSSNWRITSVCARNTIMHQRTFWIMRQPGLCGSVAASVFHLFLDLKRKGKEDLPPFFFGSNQLRRKKNKKEEAAKVHQLAKHKSARDLHAEVIILGT